MSPYEVSIIVVLLLAVFSLFFGEPHPYVAGPAGPNVGGQNVGGQNVNEQKSPKQQKYLLVGGEGQECELIKEFLKYYNLSLEEIRKTHMEQIINIAKQIIGCFGKYDINKSIPEQLLSILNKDFHITKENIEKIMKELKPGTLLDIEKQIRKLYPSPPLSNIHKKYLKYKAKYLELKKLL